MAKISDEQKQEALRQEAKRIWQWLRKHSAYKRDYLAQQNGTLDYDEAQKKWGFYPLENPKEKNYFAIWDYIGDITGINSAPEAIHLKTIAAKDSSFFSPSSPSCYNPVPEVAKQLGLPNKVLVIDVYPYKDPDVLALEFKEKLKKWQKENGIRPKRLAVGDIFLAYQARVMKGLGYPKKKIRKRIKTKIPGASNKGSAEAARQKVSRVLKKAAQHP